MNWFRRKRTVHDERVREDAAERHREIKQRGEQVADQLEQRFRRNHLSEALADLMRGRP